MFAKASSNKKLLGPTQVLEFLRLEQFRNNGAV